MFRTGNIVQIMQASLGAVIRGDTEVPDWESYLPLELLEEAAEYATKFIGTPEQAASRLGIRLEPYPGLLARYLVSPYEPDAELHGRYRVTVYHCGDQFCRWMALAAGVLQLHGLAGQYGEGDVAILAMELGMPSRRMREESLTRLIRIQPNVPEWIHRARHGKFHRSVSGLRLKV